MAALGSILPHRFCGRVEFRLALRRKCAAYYHKSIAYRTSVFNWMKFKSAQSSRGVHIFSISKVSMEKNNSILSSGQGDINPTV